MSLIKKITILNSKEIRLEEEAHVGDIIDFNNIDEKQVDLTNIAKAIESGKDKAMENAKAGIIETAKLQAKSEMQEQIKALEIKSQKIAMELKAKEAEEKRLNSEMQSKIKEAIEMTKLKADQQHQNDIIAEQKKVQSLLSEKQALAEQISLYKDFKLKMSTKMLGETLEQHCMNTWKQYGQNEFPNASFEKDNDIKNEQKEKGDFIYRENDENGMEILSIMFEMKNEADDTKAKHKNSEFYAKLDSDRNTKKCEFAVLVSLLEKDDETINGIYAVPERIYKNMYVIRPEHFLSIIRLLRTSIMKNINSLREIATLKGNNTDITAFKNNLEQFQAHFGRNTRLAGEKSDDVIKNLETIKNKIEDTITGLKGFYKNLRIANTSLEDLSVEDLVKDSPTLAEEYEKSKNK